MSDGSAGADDRRFVQLLRDLRKQPIVVVVLATSLALHLVSFLMIVRLGILGIAFSAEVAALLLVSAVLDLIATAAPTIGRFRVLHLIRYVVILGIVLIVRSESAAVDLCLLLPHIVETVLFEREQVAVVQVSIGIAVLVGLRFATAAPGADVSLVIDRPERLLVALETVVASVFTSALSLYSIRFREMTVARQRRIESLNTTVVNLSEANQAFQVYADSVESRTAERERATITRELHDTVGYALTNVIVMMNAAKVLLGTRPEALAEIFDRVGEQTETALSETRTILYRLRDLPKTQMSGVSAIRHLVHSFEGATGIRIELHQGNAPESFGQKLDAVLFRVVQEGLTNAFRHGHASAVSVQFWLSESELRLTVDDDGSGLGSDNVLSEGIGLAGMRERLAEFGGTVTAVATENGFAVRVQIPFTRSG